MLRDTSDEFDFLRNFARRRRREFLLPTLQTVLTAQFFESDSDVFLFTDKLFSADSLMEKFASAALVSTIFASVKLCREFRVSWDKHETDQGRSECLRAVGFARISTLCCGVLSEPRPSVDVRRSWPWRQVATESVISSDVSDSWPDSSDVYSPDASQSVAGEGWTTAITPSDSWCRLSHSLENVKGKHDV